MAATIPANVPELELLTLALCASEPTEENLAAVWWGFVHTAEETERWSHLPKDDNSAVNMLRATLHIERVLLQRIMQAWGYNAYQAEDVKAFDNDCSTAATKLATKEMIR